VKKSQRSFVSPPLQTRLQALAHIGCRDTPTMHSARGIK
jgi:hypothetical protein